jgi:hypothetical protein
MAQSALTVTPPSPSPPTNIPSTGITGPNPPNFTRGQTFAANSVIAPSTPPTIGPYYDDGIPNPTGSFASINEPAAVVGLSASRLTFVAPTAALTGGTSAADNNTGLTPGSNAAGAGGTGFNSVLGTYPGAAAGVVPAASSVAHEGAGAETSAVAGTQWPQNAAVYNPTGVLTVVGAGPAIPTAAQIAAGAQIAPNAAHASSLSPTVNPTLSSITPGSTVSGVGTTTLTATGVGFTKQSKVWVNGVPQLTTFVSSTSLTCAAVTKKTTAGAWLVHVVTGDVVITAPQTWTFT